MVRKQITACVTAKGQITIPLEIRTKLGLRQGDRVEFLTEHGRTTLRPARAEPNPFEPYIGALGTFEGGVEEINAWVRELREEGD